MKFQGLKQIAISTAGESPAFAQQLKREIDACLPQDLGPWLTEQGELRREVLAALPAGEERNLLLNSVAQRSLCSLPQCPARRFAQERMKSADIG
jgi:siroheme synthase (precorrin-2 oxidase/ferrochelatase)